MRYPLVFYTELGVPQGFAGAARGPVALIRPQYRGDAGLLAHEMVHVKQWWLTFGLHSILYLLFEFYRLDSEVEAYRVQLKHSPGNERRFAEFIATKYRIGISVEDAEWMLR